MKHIGEILDDMEQESEQDPPISDQYIQLRERLERILPDASAEDIDEFLEKVDFEH